MANMKRLILGNIVLLVILSISGITSGNSITMSAWADKNVDKYGDIKDLSKDIDDGEVDDDNVDWSDFKDSQAFKTADDEIQECIEDAEHLGDNLGDYEILECVDEYD
jgi:hypothetical protein